MSRATNDMSAVRMVLGPGIMYTANTVATFVGAVSVMLADLAAAHADLALVPLVLVSWLVRHYGEQDPRPLRGGAGAARRDERARRRRTSPGRAWCAPTRRRRPRSGASPPRTRSTSRATGGSSASPGSCTPGIEFLMGLGSLTVLWLGGRMVVAGQRHARRVRGLRRLPRDAQLADDRARLGGQPVRARRGVDGPDPRDPRRAGRRSGTSDPLAVAGAAGRGRVPRAELQLRRRSPVLHGRRAARCRPGTTLAIVGPTGSRQEHARRAAAAALRSAARDASSSTATTCAGSRSRCCGARSASCRRRASCSRPRCARTSRFGRGRRSARAEWAAAVAQLDEGRAGPSRRASRPRWASAASRSRAGRSSAPRSRARSRRDPRILILDDSLSAVDTETEEQILRGPARRDAAAARRSSSRTASRRCKRRRPDRGAARGPDRRARHATTSSWPRGGFYADLHRRQLLEQEIETGEGEDAA